MTPSMLHPERAHALTVPDALRQHALSFSSQLDAHPFLRRCADGSITLAELRRFMVQQGKYAAYFTRYLCALIAGLPDGDDVLALAENLSEELGMGSAADIPHARLYAQMLEGFDIDMSRERVALPTQNLIDTMFMLCRQPGAVAGLGALCLGAEAVVPCLYARIVQGFVGHGVPLERLKFFTLHIEEDDDHAATMYAILAREIAASPANEGVALHAGELAIHARLRFLDSLLAGVQ